MAFSIEGKNNQEYKIWCMKFGYRIDKFEIHFKILKFSIISCSCFIFFLFSLCSSDWEQFEFPGSIYFYVIWKTLYGIFFQQKIGWVIIIK